jgi:cytochrome c oxidase subunit 4
MSGHVSPKGVYIAIFATLMVLTGVTVGVAYIDLGTLNPMVALGIAVFKATLVVLYFMHVKYSSRLTKLTVATALFFLAILMLETMMDYATRGDFGGMPTPPMLQ